MTDQTPPPPEEAPPPEAAVSNTESTLPADETASPGAPGPVAESPGRGFWRSPWATAVAVVGLAVAAAVVAIIIAAHASPASSQPAGLQTSVSTPLTVTVAPTSTVAPSAAVSASPSPSTSASPSASASAAPVASSPLQLAAILFPGNAPPDVACGARSAHDFGPYTDCPVAPALLPILNSRPFGTKDEALCRCASAWDAVSYQTTNPGVASGQPGYSGVDVVFTFPNGSHESLLLIIVQRGGGYVLDDTQCGDQGQQSTMFQPSPAPCAAVAG